MMRSCSLFKARQFQWILLLLFLFSLGCSSIHVSTASLLEKRKYRKGHYVKAVKQMDRLVEAECQDHQWGAEPVILDTVKAEAFCSNNTDELLPVRYESKQDHEKIRRSVAKNRNQQLVGHKGQTTPTASAEKSDPVDITASSPEKRENKGFAGVIGFYFSLLGLLIPAACPAAITICVADMKGVGYGYSIIGFILGLIELIGWALLAAFLFTAGFMIWGWIIAGLLFAGLVFAILLIAGAFW